VKKLLRTSKLYGAIWSVAKLASITFLSLVLSYWIDYLGFITEGKLAAVLITSSLGVPNWSVIYIINTAPSAANKGETISHRHLISHRSHVHRLAMPSPSTFARSQLRTIVTAPTIQVIQDQTSMMYVFILRGAKPG
jgi:hypothetical protein